MLPPRLVQSWSSRQHFDVLLEAFNPWTQAALNRTALAAPTKPASAPRNVRIYATQQVWFFGVKFFKISKLKKNFLKRTVDGTRAIIDLFWDEPKEWNGDPFGYTVNCTIVTNGPQQQQPDVQRVNDTLRRSGSRAYSFAVRSGKVSCRVFALNDQHLDGALPSEPPAEIDGSGELGRAEAVASGAGGCSEFSMAIEFKPLIRLFAIDSADNLVAIQNWTIDASPKNGAANANKARFFAKNRKRRQIGHSVSVTNDPNITKLPQIS